MAKKKELHEDMLDFLKTKSSDPSELCTAAGRVLYVLMSAAIQMSDGDRENVKMAVGMLELMKQNIIEEFVNDYNDFYGRRAAAVDAHAYGIQTAKSVDMDDIARQDVRDLLEAAYLKGYHAAVVRSHDYTECSAVIGQLCDVSEELRKDIRTASLGIRIDEIRAKLAKYRDSQ